MAFQCTADRLRRPRRVPRQDRDGRWDMMAEIGFDPSEPVTFYLSVHTYPVETDYGFETEFGFCLAWAFNATGHDGYSYELDLVRRIVPAPCRKHVFDMLLNYTRVLIRTARHPVFFMETFTPHLPPKALVKYEALNEIFTNLGYTVRSAPTLPGKHKWIMTL